MATTGRIIQVIGSTFDAQFPEEDLPEKWSEFVEINAKYAPEWPVIDAQRDPLPTAEEFRAVEDKKNLLSPNADE